VKKVGFLAVLMTCCVLAGSVAGCGAATVGGPPTWAKVEPTTPVPAARMAHVMIHHPGLDRMVLFGGGSPASGTDPGADSMTPYIDTWTYNPQSNKWTDLHATGEAPSSPYTQPLGAYDPKTGRLIVCADGGTVWEYDSGENTWTKSSFTHDAPLGGGNSVVYEPTTARVILFGGMATDGDTSWYCNDTWAYDPVAGTWTDLDPPGILPHARWDAFMACDPGSGTVIMTGGVNEKGESLGDMWAYDPAANTWAELTPSGDAPPSVQAHRTIYDSDTNAIVYFGPRTAYAYDLDTGVWTKFTPVGERPGVDGWYSLAYDPKTHGVILFGGAVETDTDYLYVNDMWTCGVIPKGTDLAASTTHPNAQSAATAVETSSTSLAEQSPRDVAVDSQAKQLVLNAMTAIESAYVDVRTFDPLTMSPPVLVAIEPSVIWVSSMHDTAATAPTALAAANSVDYFGTETTYAVGTLSQSGTAFGVIVDKAAGGAITYYIDGEATSW
jgi:hypothetical protein